MSESTLSVPSTPTSSNAAIHLLAQIYLAPHLGELIFVSGNELSLTTSSSSPKTGDFLPIFKSLLEEAGQVNEAFGTGKPDSEERKNVETWIGSATATAGEGVDKKELDSYLANKTYVAEGKMTAADVAVFGALSGHMAQASHDDLLSHPNITRHFDLLQHIPLVASGIQKLSPNTIAHVPVQIDLDNVPVVERKYESSKKDKKEKEKKEATAAAAAGGAAMEADLGLPAGSVGAEKGKGKAGKQDGETAVPAENKKEKKEKAKKEGGAAATEGGKGKKEKSSGGGGGGAAPAEPEAITPGLIDMRVGLIVDVKKHPDADSLYIEQVDVGEAEPRTVVSGLVNYIPIEQMQGKYLVAICNLKPASMRGVKSFAMVLAATSPDGKEGMGTVELVAPPEGSKPGDRIYFEGFEDVKALEQLPPKKKIFETIQPGFTTLETKEAAWVDSKDKSKIHRIRTEAGYCKAPNFVGASLS